VKLDAAQKVADAILYEGYLLYPYRRSASKNQERWQFGVVVPRSYSETSGSDPWSLQTECLIDSGKAPVLHLKCRFLQLQARIIEELADAEALVFRPVDKLAIDGKQFLTWEEAIEREVEHDQVNIRQLLSSPRELSFAIPGGREVEILSDSNGRSRARIIRERWAIHGSIRLAAETIGGLIKICIRIENLTEWPNGSGEDRSLALRQSLIATHSIMSLVNGAFISLIDPPEWAGEAAAACVNVHAWPVLIGDRARQDTVLSAPIILYDYPQAAPESTGDFFDLTEIDELLTLRTMTLTEDEKREVRETDPRGAAVLDRAEGLPDEALARLHGSIRYFRDATNHKAAPELIQGSNADLDVAASPETDHVWIDGIAVSKGSSVILRPGCRPADVQDMFFRDRTALVEAVFSDLEGKKYLAVTLLDDPAADLQRSQKRFLYFYPDEIEPVELEAAKARFTKL
jgi:hypothetical protein